MISRRNITVGILEDDTEMRRWLEVLLSEQDDFTIGFSAGTVAEATRDAKSLSNLDICLVDIQLPDGLGTDFIADVVNDTAARAMILTVLGDKVSVIAALDAGADGYILKDSPPEQIIQSIFDVMDGANPMSAQATAHLFALVKQASAQDKPLMPSPSPLTQRETETLTLFAKGMSYKETASALDISSHTVREYVKSIYSKLSVHSRSEAVFEAVKLGWIDF